MGGSIQRWAKRLALKISPCKHTNTATKLYENVGECRPCHRPGVDLLLTWCEDCGVTTKREKCGGTN